MKRREEREWVLKLIYQYDLNKYAISDIDNILENHNLESKFIYDSIKSIVSNIEKIDGIIIENINNRNIDSLNIIEKAILRISVNEFIIEKSVPVSVSINEAVENAKKYANADSYKLINGILSNITKGEK